METGTKIDALTRSGDASGVKAGKRQSMEKAAEGFESFFICNMLKEMDKASHFTKKSYAEETEMSIFYEKVADFISKRGIGVKEAIMKYLSRNG